jgi:hypothetical protein
VSETPTPTTPCEACEPWHWSGWGIIVIAFALGFVNFPLQVLGPHFEHLPGDWTDNRLNNFILEHGYRWLRGWEPSFWDAPSFYPARGVTALSDAHIGMLPLYAATRLLGASPEQAFQWHFVLCFVLNYALAVWAFRRLGFSAAATAAGAFVFTFGLPMVGQAMHTQLFPRFLVPPALVFGWEFLRRPSAPRFAGAVFSVAGQVYLTLYIGCMLVLLMGVGMLVALLRFRDQLNWDDLRRAGRREDVKRLAVLAVAGFAVLPLFLRHVSEVRGTQHAWIRSMAPTPRAWLTPPAVACWSPLHGLSPLPELEHDRNARIEREISMGLLPTLAVLVVGCLGFSRIELASQRATAVVAAWSVVGCALLLTRVGDFWLFGPLLHLPGGSGVRVPSRIVLVLLFPAGVCLAWCMDTLAATLAAKGRPFAARVAIAALLVLVVLDQRLVPVQGHSEAWSSHQCPLAIIHARQARLAEVIARHPKPRAVYVFATVQDEFGGHLGLQGEVMRVSQDAGIACVNGWTGYPPAGWYFFPGYRTLMVWLEINNTTPEQMAGLVVIGWPVPDADPLYEATMRLLFPPRLLPER